MVRHVTYGQLRNALTALGFDETRHEDRLALKHRTSDTVFLFRPYEQSDWVKDGEVWFIRKVLDERGLLEPESFETLLAKAPA